MQSRSAIDLLIEGASLDFLETRRVRAERRDILAQRGGIEARKLGVEFVTADVGALDRIDAPTQIEIPLENVGESLAHARAGCRFRSPIIACSSSSRMTRFIRFAASNSS